MCRHVSPLGPFLHVGLALMRGSWSSHRQTPAWLVWFYSVARASFVGAPHLGTICMALVMLHERPRVNTQMHRQHIYPGEANITSSVFTALLTIPRLLPHFLAPRRELVTRRASIDVTQLRVSLMRRLSIWCGAHILRCYCCCACAM